MLKRYPSRIPVILESEDIAAVLHRQKYMAPKGISFGQFMFVLRNRLKLKPEQGLFFFSEKRYLLCASDVVAEIYRRHQDEDGFLYIWCSLENTFG